MLLRRIDDTRLAQYAYLIGCQKTGEAIIFDPERDVDRYLDLAKRENLRIVAVAETHIHADFLSGARELAERVGAHVYVSAEGGPDWQSRWAKGYAHTLLRSGDTFKVGNIEFRAVHTPGHTPEHMMYLVTDRGSGMDQPMGIITGDFVFVGDLGRPDLLEVAAGVQGVAEPSAHALWRSAREFVKLPDYLQVWPAHGAGSACGKALGAVPHTTVGYEKMSSPVLKLVQNEEAFVKDILSGQPEPPLYFARMKAANRDGVPVLGNLPQPETVTDLRSRADLCDPARTVVLDTRPWAEFRAGHLQGALFAPLGTMFPMVAGSYVQPTDSIAVVCDPAQADSIVRDLVRIGYDKVVAIIPPSAVKTAPALVDERDMDVQALSRAADSGAYVLDVRNASEHAAGKVKGSTNAAYTWLPKHLHTLPRDRQLLVHCARGMRSAAAVAFLRKHGFDAVNVTGGFEAWKQAGLPVTGTSGCGNCCGGACQSAAGTTAAGTTAAATSGVPAGAAPRA